MLLLKNSVKALKFFPSNDHRNHCSYCFSKKQFNKLKINDLDPL